MAIVQCSECGSPVEFARAYHVSPITNRISPITNEKRERKSWCPGCYESLHARHIRETYRKLDNQLDGELDGEPVRVF